MCHSYRRTTTKRLIVYASSNIQYPGAIIVTESADIGLVTFYILIYLVDHLHGNPTLENQEVSLLKAQQPSISTLMPSVLFLLI